LLGGILAALTNWGIFGDKLGSALNLGTTHPGPGERQGRGGSGPGRRL